jgi:hypothetical protein
MLCAGQFARWLAPRDHVEHGTTGLPSLVSEPTVGIPAFDRIIKEGWVIIATDYSFAEKEAD